MKKLAVYISQDQRRSVGLLPAFFIYPGIYTLPKKHAQRAQEGLAKDCTSSHLKDSPIA